MNSDVWEDGAGKGGEDGRLAQDVVVLKRCRGSTESEEPRGHHVRGGQAVGRDAGQFPGGAGEGEKRRIHALQKEDFSHPDPNHANRS